MTEVCRHSAYTADDIRARLGTSDTRTRRTPPRTGYISCCEGQAKRAARASRVPVIPEPFFLSNPKTSSILADFALL